MHLLVHVKWTQSNHKERSCFYALSCNLVWTLTFHHLSSSFFPRKAVVSLNQSPGLLTDQQNIVDECWKQRFIQPFSSSFSLKFHNRLWQTWPFVCFLWDSCYFFLLVFVYLVDFYFTKWLQFSSDVNGFKVTLVIFTNRCIESIIFQILFPK